MSPGAMDRTVVGRHLKAIDRAMKLLTHHVGRKASELEINTEELWIVERGLQLCAQNALDIASHVVASRGEDAPDYGSALDALV